MKKFLKKKQLILIGCLAVAASFGFNSCYLNGLIDYSRPGQQEDYSNPKWINTGFDVSYLVKYNMTDSEFAANETGKVTKTKAANRAAEDDVYNESTTLDALCEELNAMNHTSLEIDAMNAEIISSLAKENSRAATTYDHDIIDEGYNVDDTRDVYYFLKDDEGLSLYRAKGTLKVQGRNCNIWYVPNTDFVQIEDENAEGYINLDLLAYKFDALYDLETSIIGTHKYTSSVYSNIRNPVEKLNIFVADIQEPASPDLNGGVYGYFYAGDMLTGDNYQYTNETQCLYLDSYFYTTDPEGVISTIAHEFSHLLTYCNKTIKNGVVQETWYTEMIAMLTEDLFMQYLDIDKNASSFGRVPYFNNFYNYGFTTWRSGTDVFKSYANAYIFGAYLVRNFGGVEFFKEMVQNPYVNQKSITEALKLFNTEKVYGIDFNSFNKAFEYFPLVVLNAGSNGDARPSTITLNKTGGDSKDVNHLYFQPLNINNYQYGEKTISPRIFDADEQDILGSTGFSIHYIGQGIEKLYFDCDNEKLQYNIMGHN